MEYKNMWPRSAGKSITAEADLKSNLSAFQFDVIRDLNNNIQYFWTETYLLTIRFIHRKTNELFPYKTRLSN